nr:zf-CCHC domain-containing protein/UBN2 domain-containing protein [Tanacetum cinerariifolium]
MSKAKERCMTYFRSLNSHLQVLSKEDLKGTRIEHGFKRAFMSLFGQVADTFTSTMLLNVDHLQKQLDKDDFQEDGSMTAFWGVNNQFQKFIDSQVTLDYDSQMIKKYFDEYTGIEVKHFRDTLLQHMGKVKKSVFKRARHQRQYDRRVNKRLMQTQESKIDMGEAVNDDLVVTKSSGTESEVKDDNSIPIYDEEPMAKVQLTAECNIFTIGQQHTEQPEIISEDRCPKMMAIEESKDLSTVLLDELIGNLKVYEVVLEKDSEVSKSKKEIYKSLALKAKKVLSDKEVSCSDSDDNEYAMVEEKKGKEEQRCFKCGDPNHFISDCPKHSFSDQKAFIGGCWSDSEEEDDSKKDEICLMAHDTNENDQLVLIEKAPSPR